MPVINAQIVINNGAVQTVVQPIIPSITINAAAFVGGGGGGVTSVTGTTNQITAAPTTGAVILTLPSLVAFPGTWTIGTLGFADTGILWSAQSSLNSYNQVIIQNTNNGASASTNFVVNNDQGTAATNYGEFGMNSSGFTGAGAWNIAGAVYLDSISTDLAIGTLANKSIHFFVNSGITDALTIAGSGAISIPAFSTNNLIKTTGGTGTLALAVAGTDYLAPGTAWLLASGGALTGINTISGTTPSGLIFTNTWTAAANNQNAIEYTGTITTRNTASDTLNYFVIDPTLARNGGNPASQTTNVVYINGTFSNTPATTNLLKVQNAGQDRLVLTAAGIMTITSSTYGWEVVGNTVTLFSWTGANGQMGTLTNHDLEIMSNGGGANQGVLTISKLGNVTIENVTSSNTPDIARLYLLQPALAASQKPVLRIDPGAHTALAASTEFVSADFRGAIQQWATGALTIQRWNYFKGYTAAFVGASTLSDAYTVYADPPVQGTNATLTRTWALGLGGALQLFAGTTTMPPLVFQAGTNSTTIINGAIEFDGTHYTGAISGARVQLDNQVAASGWLANGATTITANTSQTGNFSETMNFNNVIIQQNAQSGITAPNALQVQTAGHSTLTGVTSNVTTLAVNTTLKSIQFNSGAISQIHTSFFAGGNTYSFTGATTITDSSNVTISGVAKTGTNASITNAHCLNIIAGTTTGTLTNSYGLTVNAQTGATNNYAAQFLGGNVGILVSAPVSNLEIAGSYGDAITSVTGNTTLDNTYATVLADATSGAITITLPTASGATRRIYRIVKKDSSANTVTISTTAGGNKVISTQYAGFCVQSNGTSWYIIGSF